MIKNLIVSIVIITTLVVGGVSDQHGRVGGLRMKRNLTPSGKTSGSSTRSSTKGNLFSKSQGSSARSGDTEAKSEKSNVSTRSEGGSKAEKSTGSTRSGGSTTKSKTGAHRLFTKAEKTSNGSSTRSGGGDAKAQKSESGSTDQTVMPRPIKLLLLIDLPTLPKQRRARLFDCKDIRNLSVMVSSNLSQQCPICKITL